MKAGNYDYASLPKDAYNTYKDASSFKTLGRLMGVYSYIGFPRYWGLGIRKMN